MKKTITTSIFDLYKIGPGPSSSHTIGPIKAALQFVDLMKALPLETKKKAKRIEILLYGSLSATGRGHGTDGAVLAGLLGWLPENCVRSPLMLAQENRFYELSLGEVIISFSKKDIHFREINHPFPYSNTIVFHLLGEDEILLEEEFYSIGGGFILRRGEVLKERNRPPYPYSTMDDCKCILRKNPSLTLPDLLLANEMAISGKTKDEILTRLENILSVMEQAVYRGLNTEGILPGPLGLHRKAPTLFNPKSPLFHSNKHMISLCAYAIAAAEENGGGHLIVTAPTSGASGVLPGLL
ncbi:MAG: serine dehydratase beta chain, partial [Chlamydiota bacterium]